MIRIPTNQLQYWYKDDEKVEFLRFLCFELPITLKRKERKLGVISICNFNRQRAIDLEKADLIKKILNRSIQQL